MKIKNLFFAGLAVLALAACSDDDKTINDVGNDSGKEIKGYLSLSIKDATTTRTEAGTEGREPGTTPENAISTVTAVITDDAGVISEVVSGLSLTGGKTDAFKVTMGTHRIYALINAPTGLTLTAGSNIQQLISVVSAADATNGYKNGTFLMVNQKHDATTNAGVEVTITSANTVNAPAPVTVYVDRVAAKIVPKSSTPTVNITTDPAAIITGVDIKGYLLLNVNKKFNLVQAWGKTNTNGTILGTEALQTPLYPGGTSALVKDQYFHNISEYTEITKDINGDITEIKDLTLTGLTFKAIDAPVYTTENRPTILTYDTNKPTAGSGETTGIIYKMEARSATGLVGTFYSYSGKIYSGPTALTDLETAYGSTISTLTIPQLRAKGVKVYEDGIMYYTYFIKGNNDNTNHLYGTENYYGVFRNSVYNLKIDNITALGDDVPGGGRVDPEKPGEPGNPPIDTDESYIKMTVTVNDWVLNTINIDF